MLVHPQFDPVAFSLGPLAVRWYGLMYLVGFALFWWLGRLRARDGWRGMSRQDLEDLLFFGVLGVIVGGRLGYVLFYKPGYYLEHPLEALMLWKGGMASHGGIIGVIAVMWLFARARGKSFLQVADFVVPLVPLGLAAGRLRRLGVPDRLRRTALSRRVRPRARRLPRPAGAAADDGPVAVAADDRRRHRAFRLLSLVRARWPAAGAVGRQGAPLTAMTR